MRKDPAQNISDAVILAGGLGTRLRGAIGEIPKPMAIVEGRPFLEWLIRYLKLQGCLRVVLSVGYKAEYIQRYFDGLDLGIEIQYSVEKEPLGTGGALYEVLPKIRSNEVLVLNGDSFCAFDISQMVVCQMNQGGAGTFWLMDVDDCSRYGYIRLGESGRIQSFHEKNGKNESGLINAGVYLFDVQVLYGLGISSGKYLSLEKEILPHLISKGLNSVIGDGVFIDIGVPEDYYSAGEYLATEFTKILD
jgi:D-glycero-alpha-D-manno-heptose 1-phosphate guanylyltransferase